MKVLTIHNFYRSSAPSGEDAVYLNERRLLEENGVQVVSYEKHNDQLDDGSFAKKLKIGLEYGWSTKSYREVAKLARQTRPDVAHVHSIHPQISPSVYAACQDAGVPVVHTLHNYRYLCPGAMLYRKGRPCEECVGRIPLKSLEHRCYRGSLSATGSVFWMISRNRMQGTFTKLVNRYVALTDFAASRLIAGGFPAHRIEIKPNFLPHPPKPSSARENVAIFVGRLSAEKGVATLITAWQSVGLPLKIVGDGPLRAELEEEARGLGLSVEFTGALSREEVLAELRKALFLVVPSESYEGFPMVVVEAYACATPVIASMLGSLSEVVEDGRTGLLFAAGEASSLASKARFLANSPQRALEMGKNARALFCQKYTGTENFNMLMSIYRHAQADFAATRNGTPAARQRPDRPLL